LLLALVLSIFSLRWQLVHAVERLPRPPAQELIPSPHSIKMVTLGFDHLLADYFWLQFIAYVGDAQPRLKDRYALADRYVDLIATLDPQFVQVYWFAAFTVGGDEHQPQRAAEIIDRGIQANPNNWFLPYIAGVNQYLYAGNEKSAARYYRMAARFPDAPFWLESQAEVLESTAPRFFKEANSWLGIYTSAREPVVKEQARHKSIYYWLSIYKSAPTEKIRVRSRQVLHELGVEVQ